MLRGVAIRSSGGATSVIPLPPSPMLSLFQLLAVATAQDMHGGMHGDMGSGMMESGSDLDFLPDLPVCIRGNYPLFKTAMAANMQSSIGTSHTMDCGITMYMPNGNVPGMQMSSDGCGGSGSSDHSGHDHSGHNHRRQLQMLMCPAHVIDATGVVSLPTTSFCVLGSDGLAYYPLFKTSALASAASEMNMTTSTAFGNFTLFMAAGGASNTVGVGSSCDASGLTDATAMLSETYQLQQMSMPPAAPPPMPPTSGCDGGCIGGSASPTDATLPRGLRTSSFPRITSSLCSICLPTDALPTGPSRR